MQIFCFWTFLPFCFLSPLCNFQHIEEQSDVDVKDGEEDMDGEDVEDEDEKHAKESFAPSNIIELGFLESIKTSLKGPSINASGMFEDVKIPEVASDEETTDYSEDDVENPQVDSEDETMIKKIEDDGDGDSEYDMNDEESHQHFWSQSCL